MSPEIIRHTAEDLIERIRRSLRDSGHEDLRSLAAAWHHRLDWEAHRVLWGINNDLFLLQHPRVPDCCPGEDHMREDGELRLPGDPGGPPNFTARLGEGR